VFCIYLKTNSDLCHLQHKLIGFYDRDEKCLQRCTDWVFKYSSLRFVCKGLNRVLQECMLNLYNSKDTFLCHPLIFFHSSGPSFSLTFFSRHTFFYFPCISLSACISSKSLPWLISRDILDDPKCFEISLWAIFSAPARFVLLWSKIFF